MKTSVALCCLALGVAGGWEPASAASPAYCALYAREYASARIDMAAGDQAEGARQRVEDQAYYRCLNLDDEPEFPTSSAYFGTADTDQAIGGPFDVFPQGDADPGDTGSIDLAPGDAAVTDTTADPPAAPVKPKPKPAETASASVGTSKGPASSGLTPWSDEWLTWCKAHYKSFNMTTGMVVTLSGDKRMCP
ncbi:MAG: BA14K family protein [Bauldia sp.]